MTQQYGVPVFEPDQYFYGGQANAAVQQQLNQQQAARTLAAQGQAVQSAIAQRQLEAQVADEVAKRANAVRLAEMGNAGQLEQAGLRNKGLLDVEAAKEAAITARENQQQIEMLESLGETVDKSKPLGPQFSASHDKLAKGFVVAEDRLKAARMAARNKETEELGAWNTETEKQAMNRVAKIYEKSTPDKEKANQNVNHWKTKPEFEDELVRIRKDNPFHYSLGLQDDIDAAKYAQQKLEILITNPTATRTLLPRVMAIREAQYIPEIAGGKPRNIAQPTIPRPVAKTGAGTGTPGTTRGWGGETVPVAAGGLLRGATGTASALTTAALMARMAQGLPVPSGPLKIAQIAAGIPSYYLGSSAAQNAIDYLDPEAQAMAARNPYTAASTEIAGSMAGLAPFGRQIVQPLRRMTAPAFQRAANWMYGPGPSGARLQFTGPNPTPSAPAITPQMRQLIQGRIPAPRPMLQLPAPAPSPSVGPGYPGWVRTGPGTSEAAMGAGQMQMPFVRMPPQAMPGGQYLTPGPAAPLQLTAPVPYTPPYYPTTESLSWQFGIPPQ